MMVKFKNLVGTECKEVLNDKNLSSVESKAFRDWLDRGINEYPNDDFSQSNFQKFLKSSEPYSELKAYDVLKSLKEDKGYGLLSKIKLVNVKNTEVTKEEEESLEILTPVDVDVQDSQIEPLHDEGDKVEEPEPVKKSKLKIILPLLALIALFVFFSGLVF